jgi:hypothetical protein
MQPPPRPNPTLIYQYLDQRQKMENYRLQESSLSLLFTSLCPENKLIEHILLKVSALNDFYSTNIYNTFSVAKHILQKNIDSRLRQNDCSLVNEIALVDREGKQRNHYSFASKYCSHHCPESFPIWDFNVQRMLSHYRDTDAFDAFEDEDLKIYEQFVKVVQKFRKHYGLDAVTLRDLDNYLWLAGKDYFPRGQKASKKRRKATTNRIGPAVKMLQDKTNVRPMVETTRSSIYDALRDYLKDQATDEITLLFKDAPGILGFSLPSSAYKHRPFWANQSNTANRPWARAWQNAGYEVASVRLSNVDGWVQFRRRIV